MTAQAGPIRTEHSNFTGPGGISLGGHLVLPAGRPRAAALLAHRFPPDDGLAGRPDASLEEDASSGNDDSRANDASSEDGSRAKEDVSSEDDDGSRAKDDGAAAVIARELAGRGVAVLVVDCGGGGGSAEELSRTAGELVAAADHLRASVAPPALLIGHALAGTALLAAAPRIPESRALVTIGAPAGRRADPHETGAPPRALLVMHAPTDGTVNVGEAREIFEAAGQPTSFVSLDGADHLLSGAADAAYAATMIAAWAGRYLDPPATPAAGQDGVVEVTETGRYAQRITAGEHLLIADEPLAAGGADAGPSPYDLLLAALGACTSMTIRMYADRERLPLHGVSVRLSHGRVHAKDCADCESETGTLDRIEREIRLDGPLNDEQRGRLLAIADKCPVHRTLSSEVVLPTAEASP